MLRRRSVSPPYLLWTPPPTPTHPGCEAPLAQSRYGMFIVGRITENIGYVIKNIAELFLHLLNLSNILKHN